jgi:hypothetical protein
MREPDDGLIRRYLLGLVPDADAEGLEEEYFARADVFERVRGVEDDLLDDHAADRLTATEKTAFETRYVASGPSRQRMVAARALQLAAASDMRARPLAVRRIPRLTGLLAIAAGMLIALVAARLWRASAPQGIAAAPPTSVASRGETPSPQPTASGLPSLSPNPVAPATGRLVLALSPTHLRGESGPGEVRIAPAVDAVMLELQGDREAAPSGARLHVAIETVEGARVWSGPARRDSRPLLVASAVVPATRLAPGDYVVTLSAGDRTLHRYFFRVPIR